MAVEKELKEVNALADERKFVPNNGLVKLVDSRLVSIICWSAVNRGNFFECLEERGLACIRDGRPKEQVAGFQAALRGL